MKPILIAACLAVTLVSSGLAPSIAAAQPQPGDRIARGPVAIVVWNIRKSLGHVRVALCTKVTFANPHKHCPYFADAPAQAGSTTVVVQDVPAGTYAAQVFQDEQDLNAVRRGAFGVPLDGVGFSNDAAIPLSGPQFKDAAFDYDATTPLTVRVKLRYFPHL
jgi:uncharacterized protein (DUF2141 family)